MSRQTKNSFILYAFDLSIDQMRQIKNTCPAYAARVLTQKAKDQGARSNDYNCGYAFSSSAIPGYSEGVRCIDQNTTYDWLRAISFNAASWVAFHHIYNPESPLVASVGNKKQPYTATVWMPNDLVADKFYYRPWEGSMQEVTSEGYVGVFGGKEYLIVNYEEAVKAYKKDGTMLPMLCAEVGSHERAVPLLENYSNNYANATEHHEQYKRILTEDATEEELQYIVPTKFVGKMKKGTMCYTMRPRVDLMKKKALKTKEDKEELVTPGLLL